MIAKTDRRSGFTLIELIVALTVGAIVATITRVIFETTTVSIGVLTRGAVAQETAWEQWILPREFTWQARLTGMDSVAFRGGPDSVIFATRCNTAFGWLEDCDATLRLRRSRDGCYISIDTSRRIAVLDRRVLRPCTFAYLIDPADGGHWTSEWSRGNTLPAALAVVTGSDTVILRVGPPL